MTLFSLTECFMSHADYTDSYIAIACMCLRTEISSKLRAVLAMRYPCNPRHPRETRKTCSYVLLSKAPYAIASDEMRLSWPFRSLLARPRFGNGLCHRLRRDALELDAGGDVFFELHLGAEEDAVSADILRGTELLTRHGIAAVALALQTDGERAEVVEHHATACEQRLGDEGFDTCQYGHDVTLGDGGSEGDVIGQLSEVIIASLHCGTLEVVHIRVLGVAALGHFVGNCHVLSFFVNGQQSTDNSQPPETNVSR